MNSDKTPIREDFFQSIMNFGQVLIPVRMKLLNELEITMSQEELLSGFRKSSLTIKEISLQMHVTSSAATQLVEHMELDGLVKRERSEDDRRVVNVSLTSLGRKKQKKVDEMREKLVDLMVSDLSDEQIRTLLNIQQHIINTLKAQL